MSAEALLREAQGYGDELSVVPEARLAVGLGATAMHDPTESGIVGAAWEMAEASGVGFRIEVDRVPVREATRAICAVLGVDPLRLIASGALLIACGNGAAMVRGLAAGRHRGKCDRRGDASGPPPACDGRMADLDRELYECSSR